MSVNNSYKQAYELIKDGIPIWGEWDCQAEEWDQFIAVDSQRMRSSSRQWLLFTVVGCLIVGAATAMPIAGANLLIALLIGPLVAAGGFLWVTNFGTSWFLSPRDDWYEQLKLRPRKVIVTPLVVEIGGTAIRVVSPELSLTRVWASPAKGQTPALMHFRVQTVESRRGAYEIWVPVAKEQMSTAFKLAQRFQSEIVRPEGRVTGQAGGAK